MGSPLSAAYPLGNTQWRLVEFQSMDDAKGTLRPDDPSLQTISVNADGTAVIRLNYYRATGTWSAEPSNDGTSGRFEFGRLATTQAGYVRGYLFKDGRLYLTLMALTSSVKKVNTGEGGTLFITIFGTVLSYQ